LEARTGKVVAAFKSPTQPLAVSTTQAWEDEGHLLTVVWDGTDWWILRLGVDGSIEKAAGPVPAPDSQPPFMLTTTR
ncbi:MAG: hypothetical protein ACXVFU_14405, partial [Nocardioidaceae bacterium]